MPRTTPPKKASAKTSPAATSTGTAPKAPESIQSTTQKSKTPKSSSAHPTIADSLDVLLPLSLLGGKSSMDCTVLVQMDPDDAGNLDFEGMTGAMGRFQVHQGGLILDLKGSQYQGPLVPGPTAMLATLWYDEHHHQQLRLEAITDEFCPLHKTQDTLAKLEATVLKGELDDSYRLQEEDVNISAKRQEQLADQQAKKQQKKKTKKSTTSTTNTTTSSKTPKKRPASSKTATTTTTNNNSKSKSNKKAKTSLGKKNTKK